MTPTRAALSPVPGRLIRLARLRAEIALDEEIIGDVAADLARKRQERAALEALAHDERAVAELAGQPVTVVEDDSDEADVLAMAQEAPPRGALSNFQARQGAMEARRPPGSWTTTTNAHGGGK